MSSASQSIVLYFLIFCSAFLALQALLGAGLEYRKRHAHANKHDKKQKAGETPESLLALMRHDRGLNRDGRLQSINYQIGKIVLQSGLPLGSYGIYGVMALSGLAVSIIAYLLQNSVLYASLFCVVGVLLPILVVVILRNRRRSKATRQLPDALDVIIRSLKAGHPVPVALALVGKEMADPIGSEFAMASDEVSFGGTVSTAVQRMADRVGQDDFDLFAAMIRLQEKTGGNLAELLESNADTIRSRQRMRLKVKAASSEGRASALILNAAPICLFFVIQLVAPDFYGDVSDRPIMTKAFWGIIGWMVIGNVIMNRMINFKI